MSSNARITKSSSLRIAEPDLTAGQLSHWLNGIEAPAEARIRVHVDAPGRGEFGATIVRIEANWEEAA